VDRAIDGLISASMPHEQMRLVVRDATGEETVSIGPRRPVIPFMLVGIPGAAVVAFIGSWGSGAPIPVAVNNAAFSAFVGGLCAALGAIYIWQVGAAWPARTADETQILTFRGSEEQVRRAVRVLEGIAPELDTGDGRPRLLDGG
jgi:hypothetical protein